MAALQFAPITLSAAKLMDLDTMLRDSRCARALRVSRLEQLRFESSSESHVLSPVSGDKCLLCTPHSKAEPSEAENLPATVPTAESTGKPHKTVMSESQQTDETVEDDGDMVPAIEEEASLYPEPTIDSTPALESRKAGEDLEDERQVPAKIDSTISEKVPAGTPIRTVPIARGGTCKHFKTKFNSTCNSKRRVQTMLFWKRHLGLSFPVTDDMLRDHVWKNLESCSYGIKRSNGHAKHARGGVCINPFHYYPVDYSTLLTTLLDGLRSLGLLSSNRTLATMAAMRSTAADDKLLFDAMCRYIQCAPINISNPMVSMPTGPTLDSRVPTLAPPAPPASRIPPPMAAVQLVPTMTPAMAAALSQSMQPQMPSMAPMGMYSSRPMYSSPMHGLAQMGNPAGAVYYYQPGAVPAMHHLASPHVLPAMAGKLPY